MIRGGYGLNIYLVGGLDGVWLNDLGGKWWMDRWMNGVDGE